MASEPILAARLEIRIRDIERQMAKANQSVSTGLTRMERQFAAAGKRVERSMGGIGGLGRNLAGPIAAAFSIQGAQKFLDASTRINNALKVAGLEGENLDRVYDRLYQSAQKNAAPLESLVTLYGRAALVQKELGVSSEELLGFTDNISLALRVAGTDAQSASGALLQLSQALGSGVVRAEEFNSILEGAPTILQAAAAGIKQAEGSVSKLRQIMLDGGLSSRALFDGIAAGAVVLEDKVAGSAFTLSQAFENVQTELVNTAREFSNSTGASEKLAGVLTGTLVPAIQELGSIFTGITTGPLGQFVDMVGTATDKVLQLAADIGKLTGLDEVGRSMGASPYIGAGRIQERIDGAFAGTSYSTPKEGRKPTDIGTIRKPNAITLDDPKYTVDADGKGKGRKGAKERADEYERLAKRITESTAATIAETEAQRQLNPLINDYGYEAEKARVARELLTAAEEAGKKITPGLREEIAALAEQYAMAGVESARLADSQDALHERMEDFRSLGKDVVGGFISDLQDGTDALDAVANGLRKVGQELINSGLESLFGKSGSSGLGLLGSLLGLGGGGQSAFTFEPGMGLWSEGGYTGQGGKYEPAGVVHKGEYVFDAASTKRLGAGNLEALRQGLPGFANGGAVGMPAMVRAPAMPKIQPVGGGGSPVVVNFNPQIDARGASVEAVARLEQQMQRMKSELPSVVVDTVRKAGKSFVKLN